MFNRLMKIMNKNISDATQNYYYLDNNTCYGGYVIEEIEANTGSISHPFGSLRRGNKEMYLSMLMTNQALETIKFNQDREKEV